MSENIEAISIVDKYLEHSRYFIFNNNGNEEVYISSADILPRNIDRRVEVTCPIYHRDLKKEIIDIFNLHWNDQRKARILDASLSNQYRSGDPKSRSQDTIYQYLNEINQTW